MWPKRRLEIVVEDRAHNRNAKDLGPGCRYTVPVRCQALGLGSLLQRQGRGLDRESHADVTDQQPQRASLLYKKHTESRIYYEDGARALLQDQMLDPVSTAAKVVIVIDDRSKARKRT